MRLVLLLTPMPWVGDEDQIEQALVKLGNIFAGVTQCLSTNLGRRDGKSLIPFRG